MNTIFFYIYILIITYKQKIPEFKIIFYLSQKNINYMKTLSIYN